MGFSSIDDLVTKITVNGQFQRLPFTRVIQTNATSAAGRWHELFTGVGTGGAGSLTGTAGLGAALNSATAGALPQASVTVTPATKHLLSMAVVTAGSTAVPAWLMLTDLLYIYPSCVVTGTASTLSNVAAKPTRFNNGAGVQCSCIVSSALGATTPTLTMTYTNQAGVGSKTAAFVTQAASLPLGSMLGGGVSTSLTGPYLPLAAGDSGVRQLDSYTHANGTTGAVAFVLHRPLAMIPLVAANTAGERDFLNQVPALPKVEDDACLALFALVGGALTGGNSVSGELLMGWG